MRMKGKPCRSSQEIARMAPSQRVVSQPVVSVEYVFHGIGIVSAARMLSGKLKETVKLVLVWIRKFDSIRDSAKECFVDEFRRIKIRREDNQLFEGNLNLFSASKCQEIVPGFERNDPPIKQVFRRHPLPAKVVNQQASAVTFDL